MKRMITVFVAINDTDLYLSDVDTAVVRLGGHILDAPEGWYDIPCVSLERLAQEIGTHATIYAPYNEEA